MFQNFFSNNNNTWTTANNAAPAEEPLQHHQQQQQHQHQHERQQPQSQRSSRPPSSSSTSNSNANSSSPSREVQSSSTATSQEQEQQQQQDTVNFDYYNNDNFSTMVFPSRSGERRTRGGRRSPYHHQHQQHQHQPRPSSTTTIASTQQATVGSSVSTGATTASNSNNTTSTGNTSMENNYMPDTDDDDEHTPTDEYYYQFPRQRSPGSDHHSSSGSSQKQPILLPHDPSNPNQLQAPQSQQQQQQQQQPSRQQRRQRQQQQQSGQQEEQEEIILNWKDIMGFDDFWIELQSIIRELFEYCKLKSWKKKILTGIFGILACLVFYDLIWGGYIVAWMEDFIWWMTYHTHVAVFAFIVVFMISALIFIPPALLLFGAGYSFSQAIGISAGIPAAIMSCFLGSGLGAIIAFVRARYMERKLIYLFSNRYPIVRAADRALKQNGFRIMLLLRLCPIIPFNGLNYCCGVTGVSLHDFITSLVGILPFQIYTVSVGATAGMLSLETYRPKPNGEDNNYQHQFFGWILLLVTGLIFGLLGVVLLWKLVKQELAQELHISKEQLREYLHRQSSTTTMMSPIENDMEQQQRQYHHHQGIEAQFFNNTDEQEGSEVEITEDDAEEWFWVWA